MNKPAVQSCMPIIDLESYSAINEIFKESEDGRADINVISHLRRLALNTSLMLNYGTRIPSSSDKLFKEIVEVEGAIARFRSTSNNWQDYVPLLRLFPAKSNNASSYRLRRDRYLQDFLDSLKQDIANGTDRPCIMGNILKDPATKLNETEMKSICLSMVGGGLETVSASMILGIGYLSSPHGQEIQERAYAEIQKVYPDGDAWDKCLLEERVPYVTALYKEILRYYTIFPMSVPRRSVEDIEYNGTIIPAGTSFYMNAFAGNHDEDYFKDANTFNPERYLGDTAGTPHFTYGAGSRICIAAHLANRELYTFYIRLIVAFRILGPENKKDAAVLDAMEVNACPTALSVQPKPCKCRFEPRNKEDLNYWLENSRKRTDNY
jgi:phenylacetate 2-hydroxylase